MIISLLISYLIIMVNVDSVDCDYKLVNKPIDKLVASTITGGFPNCKPNLGDDFQQRLY